MAWMEVNCYSMSLGMQTTVQVLLPEPDQGIGVTGAVWNGKEELPVLYLLHGTSDNSTIWMRRTSIERYNAARKLAIVMPEAFVSYYADQKYGFKYQTYVTEELPEMMHRFFRISKDGDKTFIAGLSMGGYGAMMCGLRHPDKYSKVASLSGLLDVDCMKNFEVFKKTDDPEFGEKLRVEDPATYSTIGFLINNFGSYREYIENGYDCSELLKQRVSEGTRIPELMLTIGENDFLYESNVRYRKLMDSLHVSYQYYEGPGMHEWAVWDRDIQRVLDWVAPKQDVQSGLTR